MDNILYCENFLNHVKYYHLRDKNQRNWIFFNPLPKFISKVPKKKNVRVIFQTFHRNFLSSLNPNKQNNPLQEQIT